jgi:hypothetical protein
MNCEQIQKFMGAFTDGTLNAEVSREVRAHLASCASCASVLSPVDRMELLPALDDEIEPSENFAARFHARIQERRCRPIPWWKAVLMWGRPWNLAASGVLAAILIAGVFWGGYLRETRNMPDDVNEISIAEHLPLLQDMAVINNLDLLENFDAIESMTAKPDGLKLQRSNP